MVNRKKQPPVTRRQAISWLAAALVAPRSFAQVAAHSSTLTPFAKVIPGYTLRFPRDEGSHPEFRTEWWYVTGWLNGAAGTPLGFQITFFRTATELDAAHPSAFAPRQILIAHAALSDPAYGKLRHDQRAARAGMALAGASRERLEVWIDDWTLRQDGLTYRARLPARDFQFDFTFSATQPPLLQGVNGLSRKGPRPQSASYYYSLPQLKVNGTLTRDNTAETVAGSAWLDHEWSSSYMDDDAVGWDWIGINLDDGGALMAFRMRGKRGGALWAGGAHRSAHGKLHALDASGIAFAPLRMWRSPRTGTAYPVSWRISAGGMAFEIEPLMDDQEHDTRRSTGTIYWEGAVRALQHGNIVGRGYLELTGYWRTVQF